MRRRKYKVTTHKLSNSYYSYNERVMVVVKRRGLFRRPSRDRMLYGKERTGAHSGHTWYDPPTDAQIKKVAWELAAEIEFPKPELEWCKTECKTL